MQVPTGAQITFTTGGSRGKVTRPVARNGTGTCPTTLSTRKARTPKRLLGCGLKNDPIWDMRRIWTFPPRPNIIRTKTGPLTLVLGTITNGEATSGYHRSPSFARYRPTLGMDQTLKLATLEYPLTCFTTIEITKRTFTWAVKTRKSNTQAYTRRSASTTTYSYTQTRSATHPTTGCFTLRLYSWKYAPTKTLASRTREALRLPFATR